MITYFDKVLYLYPKIQGVMYWQSCPGHLSSTGKAHEWEDLYSGLVWDNPEIPKPSKEELDALDDQIVATELARRDEEDRKAHRDEQYKNDPTIKAALYIERKDNPTISLSKMLDKLEALKADTEK